jgi:hypothetical protein
MPDFHDRLTDFCVGDDVDLRCRVTRIPAGQTVAHAWLTIKNKLGDVDADAVLQKHITTVNQAGTGQIEDAGATGTAVLRFDLTNDDTMFLKPDSPYFHDVQIKTTAGKISTPFRGLTIAKAQVTIAE